MTKTIAIMAAGRGTRMKHLTAGGPKHLLPILGRPFLEYTLDRVRAAGFDDIVIVVGHYPGAFEKYRREPGIRIIEQDLQNGRYGTAAVIERLRNEVPETFACIAGDNLYSVDDLRKATIDATACWLGGYRTAAWRGMGILKLDAEGYLETIVEKPATFVGDLVNASLYLFTSKIFEAVADVQPSPRGEYEITDAINAIARQEHINVFELEKRWLDLTAPEDIEKIGQALRDGSA